MEYHEQQTFWNTFTLKTRRPNLMEAKEDMIKLHTFIAFGLLVACGFRAGHLDPYVQVLSYCLYKYSG